ncbi:MAG TPA: hypothetical protein VGH87_28125, partial [Polyangiaceae bacterium]
RRQSSHAGSGPKRGIDVQANATGTPHPKEISRATSLRNGRPLRVLPTNLVALGAAAGIDAIISTLHLAHVGFGTSTFSAIARVAAAVAPTLASLSLFRCALAVNQGGHGIMAPSSAKSSR